MTTNRFRLTKDLDAVSNYPAKHGPRETKLAETILKNKNIDETWEQAPLFSAAPNAASAGLLPAENAAQTIAMNSGKYPFELRQSVVESTGTAVYLFPYQSSSGLALPLDANLTDGPTAIELTCGITSRSRAAFVVGTDKEFFCEATLSIADISDLGQLFFGFRKAEAYQADPDSYDEMAAWHIGETGATVADGQINIATILNNAATTYTDTTEADWANAGEHTLRVTVNKDGVCKFYIDGAEPTITKAFTFDAGEVVVPFLFIENTGGSTTGDPEVVCSALRIGYL